MRLFRRGDACLDARPARRRARQPRPTTRAGSPQRRLDGGRRARAPARCVVQGEVQRPARRDAARRPSARAPEARDVHERVRSLDRGGCAASSRSRSRTCSSSTTRLTSSSGGSRRARAVGSQDTTGSARSLRCSEAPTSFGCASESGGPDAAIPATSRTSSCRRSSRTRIVTGSSRRAADAVEVIVREGLEEAQRRFN